jgi:formate dehydrogenase subunit delta
MSETATGRPDKLIHMANQIASFFKTYPNDVAVPGIADHLHKFWGREMRARILAHLDRGGDGLDPVVVEALRILKT